MVMPSFIRCGTVDAEWFSGAGCAPSCIVLQMRRTDWNPVRGAARESWRQRVLRGSRRAFTALLLEHTGRGFQQCLPDKAAEGSAAASQTGWQRRNVELSAAPGFLV